jgi:hypothetical protein
MLWRVPLTYTLFNSIAFCSYLKTPLIDNMENIKQQKHESFLEKPQCLKKDYQSCGLVVNGIAYLSEKYAVLGHADAKTKKIFYLKCFEEGDLLGINSGSSESSSQALCLINTDKQTNICLDPSLFEGIKLFHFNVSQLSNFELIKKALDLAKLNKVKVSCDLASSLLVRDYKALILNLIPKYIDLIFANEKEIAELTQLPPLQACDFLSSLCEVVVVTMGYSGSWVKSGDLKFYTPSLKTNQIPDAGVGNFFISGFLHGYLNKASLPECSWTGSFVASKALEKGLKKFDYLFWKEVTQQLQQEVSYRPKNR